MKTFIAQAKRCLPEEAPLGTLVMVPIQKLKGSIPNEPITCPNKEYDFYKFLRSRDKWIYLGKGEIRQSQRHMFGTIELTLRNTPT